MHHLSLAVIWPDFPSTGMVSNAGAACDTIARWVSAGCRLIWPASVKAGMVTDAGQPVGLGA